MSQLETPPRPIRLRSRPDRIFISIDESTKRSTISFSPVDAGGPILHEDDGKGELAMRDAKSISETYQGSTIHGPYFHAARPPGRKRVVRRPPDRNTGDK